jgi:hypothetical protein
MNTAAWPLPQLRPETYWMGAAPRSTHSYRPGWAKRPWACSAMRASVRPVDII